MPKYSIDSSTLTDVADAVRDLDGNPDTMTPAQMANRIRAFQPGSNTAIIADDYDATATYDVGDYCIHEGGLYVCTTSISTAEAWTAGHWEEVTVGDELSGVMSDLNQMRTATASDVGKALKVKTVTSGKVTEWEFGASGGADPSAIAEAVADWLEEHPEAITVNDGTITKAKLSSDLSDMVDAINYVTPEEYGAVGDGVTDDTAAIQAAIDSAYTSGKIVRLSRKTYLTEVIAIKNPTYNLIIEGCGYGTVLKRKSNQTGVINVQGTSAVDVIIRNLTVDGNVNGGTSGNLRAINVTRRSTETVLIENVHITNARCGLYIGYWDATQHYGVVNVTVRHCKFSNNTMNELVIAVGKNIYIDDCYFDAGPDDSSLIDIESHGDGAYFDNVVFNSCHIKQNSGADVQCILNNFTCPSSSVMFRDCLINAGVQLTRMDNVKFVNCDFVATAKRIEIKSCSNTVISDCKLNCPVDVYARVRHSNTNITDNTIIERSQLNVGMSAYDIQNIKVKDCVVSPRGTGNSAGCVVLRGYADTVYVDNCIFKDGVGVKYDRTYNENNNYNEVYDKLLMVECVFDSGYSHTDGTYDDKTIDYTFS